jgi:excisionase family DNA binding protein
MLTYKSMVKKPKHQQKIPELLTLKEACGLLKCHPNTLRKWDTKGILVAVRFGERKDRRYREKDILKLLRSK